MGRILKPMVRGGGWYPSKKWIPLVKNGGYTTQNGGETEPVWATVSGSIVSFVTSVAYPMRKLLAQINPVQDLHGYDAPWAAGAGKNKLNPDGVTATNSGITFTKASDGTWTTSGTAANLVAYPVGTFDIKSGESYILTGCPSGGGTSSYRLDVRATAGAVYNDWVNTGNTDTPTPYTATEDATLRVYIRIANGYNANGLTFKPMIRLSSVSDATYQPYSNICPISGWTGLEGQRTGKNLLPLFSSPQTYSNVTGTLTEDGAIELSGTSNNIVYMIIDSDLDTEKLAGYKLNSEVIANPNNVDLTKFGLRISSQSDFVQLQNCAINTDNTLVNNGKNRKLSLRFANANVNLTGVKIRVMLRKADEDATFEPSTSLPISVTWQTEAGTVYGGTVDVVSGTMAVTHKTLDLSTLTWTATSWGGWRGNVVSDMKLFSPDENANLVAEKYKSASRTSMQSIPSSISAGLSNDPKRLFVNATDSPTGMCVYPLAEPIHYTLTPQQISTLLGNNTVFVDTGDIEVEYLESGTPTVVS